MTGRPGAAPGLACGRFGSGEEARDAEVGV